MFEKNNDFDQKLSWVISLIFPNVRPSLFATFLMLLYSNNIESALTKEPKFIPLISGFEFTFKDSEEAFKDAKDAMEKQKKETIQIIFSYFFSRKYTIYPIFENSYLGRALTCYRDDLSLSKEKLEKMKAEIESEEIKKSCEDSELKERNRGDFLKLVSLLLLELDALTA